MMEKNEDIPEDIVVTIIAMRYSTRLFAVFFHPQRVSLYVSFAFVRGGMYTVFLLLPFSIGGEVVGNNTNEGYLYRSA